MRIVQIALLCILSIGVLLGIVVPSLIFALGLGIEVPGWVRYQKVLILYAHPWASLLIGMPLLFFIVWEIWKLART